MKRYPLRLTRVIGLILFLVAVVVLGQLSGNQPRLDAVAVAEQVTGLELESEMVNVGKVNLHVVQAGPRDGPPVVLLHGFPEFWYAWRDVILPLVEQGYRVIVPDQRGYANSDKPRGVAAYHEDVLADDIAGLIHSLGHEDACVVAHDVGAWVA